MKKLNIDKDKLIKHRFWIGLAISVPLSLIAILIVAAWVPADIRREKDLIQKELKKTELVKGKELRKQANIDEAKNVADVEGGKKNDVWENAYKDQTSLPLWPLKIEEKYGFNGGYFAVDIKLKNEDPGAADSEQVFHGKLEKSDKEKVIIKGAKETRKFWRTPDSRIRVTDPDGKSIFFTAIREGQHKFASVTFERWKYFNDPLTPEEQEEFKNAYENYDDVNDILKQVDPVKENGEGVVQLKDWPYGKGGRRPPENAKFIKFHAKEWKLEKDISEEAWIVMEDVWIQKEVYRLIRLANDYVSICKPDYIKEIKKKEDYEKRQKELKAKPEPKKEESKDDDFPGKDPVKKAEVKKDKDEKNWVGEEVNFGAKVNVPLKFKNPYWELEIQLKEENGKIEKLAITISNLQAKRQRLDIYFMVKLHRSLDAEKIFIPGDPLAPKGSPGDSFRVERPLTPGIQREGVFGVEQVLNWETAAVKRIDQILIGSPDRQSQAHRLFHKPLRAYREAPKKPVGEQPGGQPGKDGGGFPGKDGAGPKDPGMPGGFPGNKDGGGGGDLGPNNIQKVRYLEVSEQSRRIPVALALIVDQDHVDRVQTAFGNSKIRFLTTQVLLSRYPSSIRPPVVQDNKGGDQQPPNKLPMDPKGAPQGGGGGEDLDGNVEMVIYGIVTLYERFPPRAGAPSAPAGP